MDINKCLVAVKDYPLYMAALKNLFPFDCRLSEKCDFSFTCFNYIVFGNAFSLPYPL
ncbi:MAG: hypothetical protein WCB90_00605 [Methanosarcina sp.]